jgi:catechol 2,3-dioxygenase-like lactoylglutathione lyase family enzyme
MADNPVITPKRFSHVGFQTYDVARLRDWYCLVLGARVVFEKPGGFCVIAYDDEHHRVAIAGLPGKPRRKFAANPEIVHTAYAYADIFALLKTYERLRDAGVAAAECMHHGPTLSVYYRDPDGNQVELFVDGFKTMAECSDWMNGPVYSHNFGSGVFFDPEVLLAQMKAGASEQALVAYPVDEGMQVDPDAFGAELMKSITAEVDAYEAAFRAEGGLPAA